MSTPLRKSIPTEVYCLLPIVNIPLQYGNPRMSKDLYHTLIVNTTTLDIIILYSATRKSVRGQDLDRYTLGGSTKMLTSTQYKSNLKLLEYSYLHGSFTVGRV